MQPRRELAAWLSGVVMLLIALTATAWWARMPDRAWEAARLLADAAAPVLSNGRIREVVPHADGSWKVRTTLPVAGSERTHMGIFFVGQPPVLKGLLAFPLLWALMLMGPSPVGRRLALGSALLAVLVLLQVAAHTWLTLAVMLRAEPSFVSDALQPPPFRLAAPPISEWEWVLSNLASYVAAIFGPVVAPLVIWAALSCRRWPCSMEVLKAPGRDAQKGWMLDMRAGPEA